MKYGPFRRDDDGESKDLYACSNCGNEYPFSALLPIADLFARVTPGETMPAGECPDCGALCDPVENLKGRDR